MLIGDSEWAGKSDNEIAAACGVHHSFVGKLRPQLATNASSTPRTGKDGRTRQTSSEKRSAAQKQRHAGNGRSAEIQENG